MTLTGAASSGMSCQRAPEMELKQERDKALKKARQYAAGGNFQWAQLWIDRATQFWPVGKQQVRNVQKLLARAR